MILRTARERRTLTQRQLAAELGIGSATLACIEARSRRPSVEVLWRLAVALELSPTELMQALGELVGAEASEIAEARIRRPARSVGRAA